MSALTDLQDAVTQLSSDVNTLITSASPGSIPVAAAESVVQSLQALDASVKAAIAAPAPAPAPTPPAGP
jgi:hypothetical protein